ncbi:LapA family protein [Jannaschia sp. W003]|uniref:LapA family protein n=1 Tax=Jannaschia sp. W003 TaxID=2867012 RepID=UPI0021A3DB40|nr:LapA family protein [Jannaschia sp. W003]UWQ20874.1 LapA family protein [Jannaschia sp. W003]
MSFLRVLFLGLLAFVLLVLALANRQVVSLRLLPETFGDYVGLGALSLPLFAVIFLSIGIGLLIGFTWEWLREHKHRAEASRQRAERERLERRLEKARGGSEEDEVLALVETRA